MRNTYAAGVLLVLAGALAGCGSPPEPLLTLEVADGARMHWAGSLPCADCAGIQTSLVLARDGDRQRWRMAETYLTAEHAERFVQGGRWQSAEGLVLLEGTEGSLRTFALLSDGRLQLRDSEGRPLPGARSADTLSPNASPGR
ncbi:copper resistance protein NlpE N-terminal domain-containing protein [Luteimonas sp. A478]